MANARHLEIRFPSAANDADASWVGIPLPGRREWRSRPVRRLATEAPTPDASQRAPKALYSRPWERSLTIPKNGYAHTPGMHTNTPAIRRVAGAGRIVRTRNGDGRNRRHQACRAAAGSGWRIRILKRFANRVRRDRVAFSGTRHRRRAVRREPAPGPRGPRRTTPSRAPPAI